MQDLTAERMRELHSQALAAQDKPLDHYIYNGWPTEMVKFFKHAMTDWPALIAMKEREEAMDCECWPPTTNDSAMNAYIEGLKGKAARVPVLEAEVERLKAVIAQHDLCHDLHGKVDAQAFADGCAVEQRKLYGCAPDRDLLERCREAIAWDQTVREEYAELLAELERQAKGA